MLLEPFSIGLCVSWSLHISKEVRHPNHLISMQQKVPKKASAQAQFDFISLQTKVKLIFFQGTEPLLQQ